MDYFVQDQVHHNTPAPIALYQGQSMTWLTSRNIVLGIGGLVGLAITILIARSSVAPSETIKIAPPTEDKPSSQQINQVVLEEAKASFAILQAATDSKIDESIIAMVNERASEIKLEAQKHLTNKGSACFRSPLAEKCYITKFIEEQQFRYGDFAASRQWSKANQALFDIKAARVASEGTTKTAPFTPAVTTMAIARENEKRLQIAEQSDNAIAATLNPSPRQK